MMKERGNASMRMADRYLGIPLTLPAAAFRRVTRKGLKEPKKIAVICLGAIGDLLLTSGLIKGLKAETGAHIEVITTSGNKAAAPLLPDTDSIVSYPVKKVFSLLRHIRSARYDLLIDTSQWARLGAILSGLSGAELTVGFKTKGQARSLPYDIVVPHRLDIHESDNFLNLGKAVYPQLEGVPGLKKVPSGLEVSGPYVIFHMVPTGRYAEARLWPAEKWAGLTEYMRKKGYIVFFSGSAADAPIVEKFIEKYFPEDKDVVSLAGEFSLMMLAGLMSEAAAVLSVNTGTMHLAAVLGVPTIGLHGPTDPVRWGPKGARAKAVCHDGVSRYYALEFEDPPDDKSYTKYVEISEVIAVFEALTKGS